MIALGTVADAPLSLRIAVLSGIGLLMTVGVYGLVAGIVKLDDAGLPLSRRPGSGTVARLARSLGRGVLNAAPWLMKTLSVAGTAAMFLVGGGILVHGLPPLHHATEWALRGVGEPLAVVAGPLLNAVAGLLAGAAVLAALTLGRRAMRLR